MDSISKSKLVAVFSIATLSIYQRKLLNSSIEVLGVRKPEPGLFGAFTPADIIKDSKLRVSTSVRGIHLGIYSPY